MTDTTPPPGCRTAPDEVWEQVRADYLSGLSAPACCRKHGVGLTALRDRAAKEGWRRADQPWRPPGLDPDDEGAVLEERVDGDLGRISLKELRFVCERRTVRAILRGDGVEAMRWRRLRGLIRDEEFVQWSVAKRQYTSGQRKDRPPHPDDPDDPDDVLDRPDEPAAKPADGG